MESFRSFITAAQKTKKGPDGYRFDERLKVCVPIGVTRYYPYFGGKNGNGQNNQPSDDTDNNTNGNGTNGNGSNGNGTNGNGNGGE